MIQNQPFAKANPPPNPPALLPSDAAIVAEIAACADLDFSRPVARSRAHRQLTPCIRMHHGKSLARSKPLVRETSELTTRQLAAARLVVQGRSSSDVAKRIGTIRQTINRWKKLPAFVAEIRLLHEMLVRESLR